MFHILKAGLCMGSVNNPYSFYIALFGEVIHAGNNKNMVKFLLCVPPIPSTCYQALNVVNALKARGHQLTVISTKKYSSIFAENNIDIILVDAEEVDVSKLENCFYFMNMVVGLFNERHLKQTIEKTAKISYDCVLYYPSAIAGFYLAKLRNVPAFCISPYTQTTTASWKNFTLGPCSKFWRQPIKNLAYMWMYYGASFRLFKTTGYALPKFYDISTGNGDLQFAVWLEALAPQPVSKKAIFIGEANVPQPWAAGIDLSWMTGNCVYISTGTIVSIPIEKLKLWVKLLANKPYKVVIKVSSDVLALMPELPTNIRLSPFVNQVKVLKRASVFVTHAGCNSILEAANFGVPVLARPEIMDQFFNAEQVVKFGAGLSFSKETFDKNLRSAIDRLLNEPSFKENMKKIGEMNRIAGGTTKLIDTIETHLASLV